MTATLRSLPDVLPIELARSLGQGPRSPIDRVLDRWARDLAPSSAQAYRGSVDRFARWLGAQGAAAALAALAEVEGAVAEDAVARWRDQELARGCAPATVARGLAAVRSLLRAARRAGLITWTVEIRAPRVTAYRDTAGPGTEALRRLLAVPDRETLAGRRDYAALRLLTDLALRRGEVAGARLDDLEVSSRGPSALNVHGKGGRTTRFPLPERTAEALAGWLAVRGPDPSGRLAGRLFGRLGRSGTRPVGPLSGEGVQLIVERLTAAAGVSVRVRPHGIRHTVLTAVALKEGVLAAQAVSRHSSLDTLQRYLDQASGNRERATNSIVRLLSPRADHEIGCPA